MIEAKICGLKTAPAVDAALAGDAHAVGFVFYPPSPRNVDFATAGRLSRRAAGVLRVGLFVDPSDAMLAEATDQVDLDLLQLHGEESPERVDEIKGKLGINVMKAIRVRDATDLTEVARYEPVTDWLLFDAKMPALASGTLPGGNGVPFDWRLLAGRKASRPWMLSGGLDTDNVADAVAVTGARWVDVSSGVETAPGVKSLKGITAFLKAVRNIH